MTFQIEDIDKEKLKFIFSGRLDVDTVAKLWHACESTLSKYLPHTLILDLKNVDYCDGAGIALIQTLQKKQANVHKTCIVSELKPEFQHLLEFIEQQSAKARAPRLATVNLPEHLGHIAVELVRDIRNNIIFLGILAYQSWLVIRQPKKIRWADFWRFVNATGPGALSIIALTGFLIGLISTFQAAASFRMFGAEIFMVNLVGLGLTREMGPLLVAVLLAGRTASSFAAEIGTMKINQEIDALSTMGINPIRFLVVPRILATLLVTPALEAFFILFGLFGCLVVMNYLGFTVDAFTTQLCQAVKLKDCIGGLVKVFVFGWVIAGVGCLHGIKTRFGAQAVGVTTTQAVVSSLIMLVIVDGIFAVVYYVLGI